MKTPKTIKIQYQTAHTENAKIVGPTDRTGQNIKRSDAHDDRVRPIVRIRLIHCTRSFHLVTLTLLKFNFSSSSPYN